MDNKVLSFSVEYFDIVKNDDTFAICEVDLLHLGLNRNRSIFTKEGVEKSLDTFYNKPLLCIYNCKDSQFASDFTSHAQSDLDSSSRAFVGVIPMKEFSVPHWVVEDGKERLRVRALIWSFYCPTVLDILSNQNNESKVSIEVEPLKTSYNKDGNLVIEEFRLLGCSFLSNKVTEGMEGSKLKLLQFSYDDMLSAVNDYITVFEKEKIDNSIFDKLKKNKEGIIKMSNVQLVGREIWSDVITAVQRHAGKRYYVENIYEDHIVLHDLDDHRFYSVKCDVDPHDKSVKIHWDSIAKMKDQHLYAEEDIGTGPAIKINKSVDKMVDSDWGAVDKSDIRKEVIRASNGKTVAKDIFLQIDEEGFNKGNEGALKYPVMQKVDGEYVYNRNALASAKGYATQYKDNDVLEKLKKIYNDLSLDFDCDDCDDCDDVDGFKKIKRMSADANVDPTAHSELLDKEAEVNKDLADEHNPSIDKLQDQDKDIIIAELKKQCDDYKTIIDSYECELAELRKFKADAEERQKLFRVEEVLKEVGDALCEDEKANLRNEAKDCKLEDLDVWSNKVFAESYKRIKEESPQATFAMNDLWEAHIQSNQGTSSLWRSANK